MNGRTLGSVWSCRVWGIILACAAETLQGAGANTASEAPEGLSVSNLTEVLNRLMTILPTTQPAQPKTSAASQPVASAPAPIQEPADKTLEDSAIVMKGGDRVEIHVSDAPLSTVLRVLSAHSRRNIVASPRVKGVVTADLFDVSLQQALDSILRANDCGSEEHDGFIYIYTLEELAQRKAVKTEEPMVSRLFRLNHVSVKDIQPLIEKLKSAQGQIATTPEAKSGIDPGGKEAGGNSLSGADAIMIYDLQSRIDEIAKVIRELDVRPRQVLIEATILRAAITEDNALGVDFNLVTGVDFQMLNSTSPAVTSINPGELAGAQLQNTNATVRTDFNQNIPLSSGGFTFGIIKDNVGVFLRALEQVTDTTVLANPKILALNKQRGHVHVGREDGYMTTTVTQTTAVQTVDYLVTGTQLVFRPYVGEDGYVRMELHPEDSTGGLTAANLPYKTTTEVTTNILVKDGHTILIGGLFRESTSNSRSQVPVIGNVPFMGNLFRSTSDKTSREEVIILLTVHVIKDDNEYAQLGEDLTEDVHRIRVGARRGILSYGRDRLAMAYYHTAMKHAREGRPDKALRDVSMCLHVSPTYLPAMKLKERFAGNHSCDNATGAIREVINRRIISDQVSEQIGPPPPGQEGTP